jgi:hypothetical protein
MIEMLLYFVIGSMMVAAVVALLALIAEKRRSHGSASCRGAT